MEPVQILKALPDETRFKLVGLLLTHDLCVGALAKQLSITAIKSAVLTDCRNEVLL